MQRRTPEEVTYDRLGDFYEEHHDKMSGAELDAVTMVRQVLFEISEGER